MSRWSESIYSEPNTSRNSQHGFLTELDARLYEGVPMSDPQLDAEAGEWAARFLHLRVRGVKCNISTGKPNGGGRNGDTREGDVVTDLQLVAEANLTRSSKSSPVKRSSKTSATNHSATVHLPKLNEMKR
ncbi:hypothetical protein COOONC_08223 [Cooperia oncophora]